MNHKPLSRKPQVIKLPDFWTQMSVSSKRFLALDYDGTLAPFRIDRAEAYPLPGIVDTLKEIERAGKTFLAIVSGRPISEVISFLDGLNITFVGSHGFELKHPGHRITLVNPDSEQLEGLRAASRFARDLELEGSIEIKTAGVALHTRAMEVTRAELVERRIYETWSNIASSRNLRCRRFSGGIEIVAGGWNKGDVVLRLIEEAAAEFNVYIGDDTTDEDVFRSLPGYGVGIRVGNPEKSSMAAGFLRDCGMVQEFLGTWLSVDSGEKG